MNNTFMTCTRSSPRLSNIRRERWLQYFNNAAERCNYSTVRDVQQLIQQYEFENEYQKKKIMYAIYKIFIEYPFIVAQFPKVRQVSIQKIEEYIQKGLIGRSAIDKKIKSVFYKFKDMLLFIHLYPTYVEQRQCNCKKIVIS